MVKYASDMIRKLRDLIATDLADRLGEDTRDLALRVGIHSGPVTAGVLRGDKGRFQVFGDTVVRSLDSVLLLVLMTLFIARDPEYR